MINDLELDNPQEEEREDDVMYDDSEEASEDELQESNEPETDADSDQQENQEQKEDDSNNAETASSRSSEHGGKYFIIQKGKAQCNQGDQFPQFKVTSHQKHYWNKGDGSADYLAVTEEDLQFMPSGPSFGQCKLKPSSGGYLPCAFAPSGKWQKTYDKTKVMGKACLTELSELMCATGGKITIKQHGQKAQLTSRNFKAANTEVHAVMNPAIDMDDFNDDENICD